MKKLIITCDDCGLSEGINRTALELHQRGMVTSASVMTNFAAASHAVALFAQHPSLTVGAHLNLTDGFSLTQNGTSGLTYGNGRFRSPLNLLARSAVPTEDFLERVEKELAAQINFLLQAGVQPQHLTTHGQFHALPSLRKIVFKLARDWHIPWIRASSLRSMVLPLDVPSQKRNAGGPDRSEPVAVPETMVVLQFWTSRSPHQLLAKLLSLQGTTEIAAHLCQAEDATFPRGVRYLPSERYRETRYLEQLCSLIQREMKEGVFQLVSSPGN